ncbi:aldo/keto reductase [Halorubrum lacusprofundi]|uniref:Aldo/keto reductase n=1 Tax=Halorubrum lacusprofundi (strain ATCC 49239 / DSM 5036 / JCM 8891 / ACAM 34) TaxID=416348 RepID=B9LT56_HALLT|nr:aldo/keto reductase [Halorubrum lacusprofundi]ACM56121.1 aldo/keto reductase [Halorubrum lacusprofundi ATCC 49239]MCG1005568.1 aldo/keto reductase [Halorubrum lacusprofundi]
MNCLFVGAGSIAPEYAAGLSGSSLSLAGVVDLDADRAAALAADHDCPSFTDLETALSAVDAPLVVNLTSHAAHAPVTRTALEADRHVYSQKPLALDADEAKALVALARERDLGLGCAPGTPRAPSQRRAGRLLADGRLGPVGLGYAHAHVGRVTDWHDRPDSFLEIGPLYDGAVYPLALLASWFGPVERVRVADALDVWPEREDRRPSTPSHVEATLAFAAGPTVRLTASFYAPHRSREFYGLELHGDDGSLYLKGTGAMETGRDHVRFGRVGREYVSAPPTSPEEPYEYVGAVERLAATIEAGSPSRAGGRRGAHVVAVCNAIEAAAGGEGPVVVDDCGATADPPPAPVVRPATTTESDAGRESEKGPGAAAIRLPAVGFGCSRYRDGEYVDRVDSIATALDAGYRLLDSAELYGNEHRIGELLAAPGAPDRERVFLLGKAWRTNHRREHLLAACAGSREELGIDAFDCYALHWPSALEHRGELNRLAEKPVERQETLTFPEGEDGEPATADVALATAWRNLEAVHERGWARTLGICNVSRAQLETVLETGEIDPALVQVERHPYRPRNGLVELCHGRGIRVVAHSPLSAPGLLDEPVLNAIGTERGLSPAEVVIAWNASQGVVPIPSSTAESHVVSNLAAGSERLTADEVARIDALRDPNFER